MHYCILVIVIESKAQDEFTSILSRVLRSDWSVDLPSVNSYYVTWGANHSFEGMGQFGKPLGKLASSDLAAIISKALVAFGELNNKIY